MPRTTLDLDDAVLRELHRRRSREGRPIGVIASQLLARAIAESPDEAPDLVWTAAPMGAKVDIEDKDALHAVLDQR